MQQVTHNKRKERHEKMEELTLEKFEEASEIVSRVTLETKLKYSEYFSNQTGNKVYFKPENIDVYKRQVQGAVDAINKNSSIKVLLTGRPDDLNKALEGLTYDLSLIHIYSSGKVSLNLHQTAWR